jgi:hypothetical protein
LRVADAALRRAGLNETPVDRAVQDLP